MIVFRGRFAALIISLCVCGSVLLPSCLSAAATDCSTPYILLNAFDRNTGTQLALHPEDLEVEVDHKQLRILTVSLDTNPRQIVLMVDTSGSMGVSPPGQAWGVALPAAAYAVEAMPSNASSTLVTFGAKVGSEARTFEDKRATGAKVVALAKLQPQGSTLLFDSIDHVLAEFQELRPGDSIYLVTDGGDNKSRISFAKLKEKLISLGIRTFVFLVVKGGFQTQEEIEGVSEMETLAESTGGAMVRITSADIAGNGRARLDKLASQIAGQVSSVYRVGLDIPNQN
jgi:von Willebrand factor type A domain